MTPIDAPAATETVEVLEAGAFRWDRRPHRVSHVSVAVPSAGGPAPMRLEGGSWADGRRAADEVDWSLRTRTLGGARFYPIATGEFALHGERRLEGDVTVPVRFPAGALPDDPARIVVFVDGFAIDAAGRYARDGATVTSLDVGASWTRDGDVLSVGARIGLGVAPVPERRQRLGRFAASGAVDLVVAVLPAPATVTTTTASVERPFRVLAAAPEPLACEPAVDADAAAFVAFAWSTRPGVFPGRYVRGLALDVDAGADGFDNSGAIARRTRVAGSETVAKLDGVQVLADTCYTRSAAVASAEPWHAGCTVPRHVDGIGSARDAAGGDRAPRDPVVPDLAEGAAAGAERAPGAPEPVAAADRRRAGRSGGAPAR
jgi:hypothetical protein